MERTEREQHSALGLGRAFLHEAAKMLLRPLATWDRTSERDREQYVGRSAAGIEEERARQDSEQREASKPRKS